MKADAISLLEIFEKKMRLEVPLFQRQYVWSRDQQWEPLWEDISRKFSEYLEGRKDAPVHFLGAMVLDQKQTPIKHIEKRQIIDGQQRLTTLQIFIAAFRDFCKEQNCIELSSECENFTFNKGMMVDHNIDKFKVWPTQLDRKQFSDVVSSGSKKDVEKLYPLVYRKYARKPDIRPKMVEAYLYFYDQLNLFFIGNNVDNPIAAEISLSERLEECFQSLKNSLQVVVIDLDSEDDAQVIFETLNARGEPLLPADLLRNYIFLRAARNDEPQEELYNKYWKNFDDHFWRVSVKQGRLFRPRSDLFMQHFLSSRQTVDIPIKHLFVEYKYWIEKNKPFKSVEEELCKLSNQGNDFKRIVEPEKEDTLKPLSDFLNCFDVRTCYPLILAFLDLNPGDEEIKLFSKILESYILRRSVCGYTTKNYNKIFLMITRNLRKTGINQSNFAIQLRSQIGESTEWPTDATFSEAWKTKHVYQTLNNSKVVYIFKKINSTYLAKKSEDITIDCPLSVEHLLPQNWVDNWPLPDNSKGLNVQQLWQTLPNDKSAIATRQRNALLQTFGNLTILTQSLNSSASNSSWNVKKSELLKNSLLPINQCLYNVTEWNETEIIKRGDQLLQKALMLWPR